MMQTLYGVDYIHSRGYLHRDIKTPNLLVLKRNYLHVKITDFGLAVRRKKNDQSNTPPFVPHLHGYAGTDCYICPEALQSKLSWFLDSMISFSFQIANTIPNAMFGVVLWYSTKCSPATLPSMERHSTMNWHSRTPSGEAWTMPKICASRCLIEPHRIGTR